MSISSGAAERSGAAEEWVAAVARTAAATAPVNPFAWELQQKLGSGATDTHPLMGDHEQSSAVDSHGTNNADYLSPAVPALSVSSAASTTFPPGTSSRPPPNEDQDESEWGESSFDNSEVLNLKKLTISEASSDYASLRQLMREGSWRAIADKVKEVRKRSMLQAPDEKLVYSTYHVLALMKLRSFDAAQDELSAVGDLNSPKFRFENHPDVYPNKSGSMVPFGLRWLHAELPCRLGQTSTTVDRLYDLLAHCNERVAFLNSSVKNLSSDDEGMTKRSSENTPPRSHDDFSSLRAQEDDAPSYLRGDSQGKSSSGQPALVDDAVSPKLEDVGSNFVTSADIEDDDFGEFVTSTLDNESNGNLVYSTLIRRWRRRQEVVLCSVLSHHLNQKDFVVCLNWLEDLVKKRPHDMIVLSKYGYVQLQLGDLYGARRTFATVEAICEQQGRSSSPVLATLLCRNRGLLYFSLKQYTKAVKEFDAVLESEPGDVVSANNKALCLMYSRDLVGATQVLETVLQRSPITALNETLVLNLCSMYELASMNSVESKKTLSSWILRIAPDDFDLTCTRL